MSDLGNSECFNLDYLPMDFDFWPMWDWDINQDFQQQLNAVEVPVVTNKGEFQEEIIPLK